MCVRGGGHVWGRVCGGGWGVCGGVYVHMCLHAKVGS